VSPAPFRRRKSDRRLYDDPDGHIKDFGFGIMRSTHGGEDHCPWTFAAQKLRLPAGSGVLLDNAQRVRDLYDHALVVPPGCPQHLARADALWRETKATVWSDNQHLLVMATLWMPMIRVPHLAWRQAVGFAQQVSDAHGVGVHVIAHAPAALGLGGDFHVHLLCTARRLDPTGLGAFAQELYKGGGQRALHAKWVAHQAATPAQLKP
jgi:hypothetical protein